MLLFFLTAVLKCGNTSCINGRCTNDENHNSCSCFAGYTSINCDTGKVIKVRCTNVDEKKFYSLDSASVAIALPVIDS